MGDNGTDMDNMFSEDMILGHYKVLRGQSAIDVKNYISRFSGIHLDLDVILCLSVTRYSFLGQSTNQVLTIFSCFP